MAALGLIVSITLAGCTTGHYRKSADKESYSIIQEKQKAALGHTNAFNIDTPYSARKPEEIKPAEILTQRSGGVKRKVNLSDVLKLAVASNRSYQTRKETVYLTALQLTRDRDDFKPHLFGGTSASGTRGSGHNRYGSLNSDASVANSLKGGGRIGIAVANDILHYFTRTTGNPQDTAASQISVNLFQPLLRGAGASIAAENLTQSERNVVYDVRSFTQYQLQFSYDVISAYFRLLQQKDTVRNEYNNYLNLVKARERAEALSRDRLPAFQVDQASQDELSAKIRYISTVASYQAAVDNLKLLLSLPLAEDLSLDDNDLKDLDRIGLPVLEMNDEQAFSYAIEKRLDLLNEIDRFEDAKRRIHVAADGLKADLNLVASGSLVSNGPEDYAHFDKNSYQASAGVQLNLPLWRLRERNTFRSAQIAFERQIRSLAQTFDDTRNKLRQDLRNLQQARQKYDIQKLAVQLADKRVESVELLILAGRAQVRDQLDAASSQVQARNALTQALVDYHLARLNLLVDLGVLNTSPEKFWLAEQKPAGLPDAKTGASVKTEADSVVPPDKLFAN